MITSAQAVQMYTRDSTFEDFVGSRLLYDGTVRQLELIGEAARHVPANIRTQMPEVEWRGIIGLRNVLIHDYRAIDDRILWRIIQIEVPDLHAKLVKFMGSLGDEDVIDDH